MQYIQSKLMSKSNLSGSIVASGKIGCFQGGCVEQSSLGMDGSEPPIRNRNHITDRQRTIHYTNTYTEFQAFQNNEKFDIDSKIRKAEKQADLKEK